MLAERSPDEQSYVGPTLASNVGPTELITLSQRWPNVVMLSGEDLSKMTRVCSRKLRSIFMWFPWIQYPEKTDRYLGNDHLIGNGIIKVCAPKFPSMTLAKVVSEIRM